MKYLNTKDRVFYIKEYMKSFLSIIVLVVFSDLSSFAQDSKLHTKLGVLNSVNNNTVTIMGCGTKQDLHYIYFSSPWLCEREIKIPREYLNQAKESINLIDSKFKEWHRIIQGKGFKGKRKVFSTEHIVYTRQSYLKDWHPMPEKMYYVFFIDLSGRALVEVKMTLGNSTTFCFYLTDDSIKQYVSIINNAEAIYLKSDDAEFDKLLN